MTFDDLPHQPLLDNMDFPRITPRMPTPGTDEAVALEMMLKTGWTGPDEFHGITGSHRLAASIVLLKRKSWPFIRYVAKRPLPKKPHRTVTLYAIDFEKINLPVGAVGASHE